MNHPGALIVIGCLALLWALQKEPRWRTGEIVTTFIKFAVVFHGIVMIGFGLFQWFHR
jgi:hypothetical protein